MCISFFLFNLNVFLVVLHTSGSSDLKNQGEIIDSNLHQNFRCNDGQYVAKLFVCDGIPDCRDNSDETRDQCKNITCNEQNFQCDYGACISKEYLCDGLYQCIDRSDETIQACNIFAQKSKRSRRAAGDSCPTTPPALDKVITYDCNNTASKSCGTKNGYVPEWTVASIKCKPNYFSEKKPSLSFCYNNDWEPPFENCLKKCEKLNPVNVDLKCNRRGVNIPCDENMLLAGSKVRPTCAELHKYGDVVPNYREITCKENGKWDKTLFSCVPECGRQYVNPKKLILDGVEERFGESPWHVAIYNPQKVLICGGTIISPYLVLSAAHCFEKDGRPIANTANYEVVVSKMSRNYFIKDNHNQKAFKIKETRFSNKGYFGQDNYNTADIVALILDEKLKISATVLPACLDWTEPHGRYPEEGTLGKVSGWGLIERDGNYSETLMTVDLPFISRQRCYNTVPDDFKPFITLDKFCAGRENGAGVLQGDSGGGLLFREGQFYYLRGIVSLKQTLSTSIAAFTDLADHMEWVLKLRDEVENKMSQLWENNSSQSSGEQVCRNYGVTSCMKIEDCSMADYLVATKRAVFCGYNADNEEKICCSLPNSLQFFFPLEQQPTNKNESNSDASDSFNNLQANLTTVENQQILERITKGILRFAIGFVYILAKSDENENILLSPTTIIKMLSTISLGAANQTEVELKNTRLIIFRNKIIKQEHERQLIKLLSEENAINMVDGVAVFLQKGYSIHSTYIDEVKNEYKADVIELDFEKDGTNSIIAVNKWVSDRSGNTIKEIPPIDRTTKLQVVGVVYFKTDWKYSFFVGETRWQPFFTTGQFGENISIQVQMMVGEASLPYYEDNDARYRAIGLPQKDATTYMYIILPKQNLPLKNFTATFYYYDFANITQNSKISDVSLTIPKMHLESTHNLKSGLEILGCKTLFNPLKANLNKITNKQLHVSEILQKAVIDVNEKGTTVNLGTASHLNDDKYINFRVDRPFFFFIYNVKTKVTTLWASIEKPTPYK